MKMKMTQKWITLATIFLLAGCEKAAKDAHAPMGETKTTLEDVKEEVGEAVVATKEYVADSKADFVKGIYMDLRMIGRDIDALGMAANNMTGEAKRKMDAALIELHSKRVRVESQAEELADSSEAAWEDLKTGLENAMGELKKSVDEAGAEFDG